MTMKNWKVWTAFLAVFAAGIVVGVVGVGLVIQHHFASGKDHATFRKKAKAHFLARFVEQVEPDEEALPAIKAIIDKSSIRMDAIRRETAPRIREVLSESDEEIRKHLTDEQAKRFDKMIDNIRHRRIGLFKFPPPPPPPFP